MEQKNKIGVNIFVCIITLIGFTSMLLISSNTYSVIIKDDIKNILVQIHSDTKLIQKRNLFDDKYLSRNKSVILDNKDTLTVLKYKEGGSEGYMIIKYIEELNWYLLVKKDTSVLEKSFWSIILKDIIIFNFSSYFCIINDIKINKK